MPKFHSEIKCLQFVIWISSPFFIIPNNVVKNFQMYILTNFDFTNYNILFT